MTVVNIPEITSQAEKFFCCWGFRYRKEYDRIDYIGCHEDCITCPESLGISQSELEAVISKFNGLPWLLGLSRNNFDGSLVLSHYSGAVWLRQPGDVKGGIPLVVAP
jgi:hypothetical protein